MTLHEITDAANIIHDAVLDDATVIIGTAVNENISNEIQVTVIATGFELKNEPVETAQKPEIKQLSASDFFANSFNQTSNSNVNSQTRRSSMPEVSSNFTNIEIPDFLK